MPLTFTTLRKTLAAALAVTEAGIGETLDALVRAGLVADGPINAVELALALLAIIANVPPECAATEAARLGDFALSGETEQRTTADGSTTWRATPWPAQSGSILTALVGCITQIAAAGEPLLILNSVPLRVRLQRAPHGEFILLEWSRRDGATSGLFFAPATQTHRPHSSMTATADVALDWLLLETLALQIGPAQAADDDDITADISRPTTAVEPTTWMH